MSSVNRSHYTIHWDRVTTARALERTGPDRMLLAIWPAPVKSDDALEGAGFTEFGDTDAGWERNTAMAVGRLLSALGAHGQAQLVSVPLKRHWSFFLRLFISEQELPLSEQVKLPMFNASLPGCVVTFGNQGVSLRSGGGHALWWVELPESADAPALVAQVAGGLPVVRTSLRWEHLL